MSAYQVELFFAAPDAEDAARQARAWAHAEPGLQLVGVAKVRRDTTHPNTANWIVTVAVRWRDAAREAAEA